MICRATYIGTATLLLEIGGLKLITDPTFDPAGACYHVGSTGRMASYTSVAEPALSAEEVGTCDIVLLSHDHHGDNFDDAGRELSRKAGYVLTTQSGQKRLTGKHKLTNVQGMKHWETKEFDTPAGFRIKVTAIPARHGPPIIAKLAAGDVIGFVLEWEGQEKGAVYISGDTRLFRGVYDVAKRFNIGTAILNVGAAGFWITGPMRYTMTSKEAAKTATLLQAPQVIPLHFEGWSHFQEGRNEIIKAYEAAGLNERLTWLERGKAMEVVF
ncbi:MAG: MBL fold metallo-hydrolase [Methyloligellaceae bacterium]